MQIDPYLSPCIKLKSKWIKDLKINAGTLNLIDKKVGNNLEHISTVDNFLNRTPITQILKSTINKWDLRKQESFCKAKDTINRTNSSLENGKRYSPTPHQTKG